MGRYTDAILGTTKVGLFGAEIQVFPPLLQCSVSSFGFLSLSIFGIKRLYKYIQYMIFVMKHKAKVRLCLSISRDIAYSVLTLSVSYLPDALRW